MGRFYFINEKSGRKYEIIEFNQEAGTVRLKGEHAEFTEKYDKDRFKSWGYTLKQA